MPTEAEFISRETVDSPVAGMVSCWHMTTFTALRKQTATTPFGVTGSCGCAQPASLNWYASFITWVHSAGYGHV